MSQARYERHDAGDVGRRIAERQSELKLTISQVAERAGVATNYLDHLEQTPTAEPPSSTLLRIALALDISALDLLGGESGRAHGRGDAAPEPQLVPIDQKECAGYLAQGGVRRAVFRAAGCPVAFPVNFKMLAGDIIFRSAANGEVAAIAFEEPVSFEVDRIDDAMREGWSVLATGTVHRVLDPDQIRQVEALGTEPWAGGERHTYFRVAVTTLTGKRINAVR